MIRINEKKIDTPEYYDTLIWPSEMNTRPYYDGVRQRALGRYAKPGCRLVDLGAGCFGTAQYLAEQIKLPAELFCVDYSKAARDIVVKALAGVSNFSYVVADVLDTPLRQAWFDCVVAGEIIEHIEEPWRLAREMARLCKPGGWMTLSTVNPDCSNAIKHGPYPEHIWRFEPEELRTMFALYGAATYELVGDYHFVSCQRHNTWTE